MFGLVANSTRSHGGVEMRFVDLSTLKQKSQNSATSMFIHPSTSSSHNNTTSPVATPEHLDIPNRVQHWFRGGHKCRLCNAIHLNPKEHFQSGVEARHHVIKEILLSYWMDEDKQGLPFTGTRFWEKRLAAKRMDSTLCLRKEEMMKKYLRGYMATEYWNKKFARDQTTSDNFGEDYASVVARRRKSLEQRALFLHCLLRFFKDVHVLGASLNPARPGPSEKASAVSSAASDPELQKRYPHRIFTKSVRNTVRFESLEYTGDSLWGFEATARLVWLMPHRDWLSVSHAWAGGILRDGVESNDNLMKLAELMGIERLLAPDVILGGGKPFADILEAIMGELQCRLMELNASGGVGILPNLSPGHNMNGAIPMNQSDEVLATMIRFAVDEINDLATLNFGYFHVGFDAERRLVPFARELLQKEVLMKSEPALSAVKMQRTSNLLFRGRRLRGINSPSYSLSSSSSSSSPPIGPGSFFDEFTFIDYKLQDRRESPSNKNSSKINREKDRLSQSAFFNEATTAKILFSPSSSSQRNQNNNNNDDTSAMMGSFYEKKINEKSFQTAMSNFLDSFPGEKSFADNYYFGDDHDEENKRKNTDNNNNYAKWAADRTRIESFAMSCIPELTLMTNADENNNDANGNSSSAPSLITTTKKMTKFEFARNFQPRADAIYGEATTPTTLASCDENMPSRNESDENDEDMINIRIKNAGGGSRLSKYKPVDESRIFPIHAPFETNTGWIPQIVLDTEAKRISLANERKKMRKNRRI